MTHEPKRGNKPGAPNAAVDQTSGLSRLAGRQRRCGSDGGSRRVDRGMAPIAVAAGSCGRAFGPRGVLGEGGGASFLADFVQRGRAFLSPLVARAWRGWPVGDR